MGVRGRRFLGLAVGRMPVRQPDATAASMPAALSASPTAYLALPTAHSALPEAASNVARISVINLCNRHVMLAEADVIFLQ